MRKKTIRRYTCPFCGQKAIVVIQTSSFSNSVERVRSCLFCGRVHKTIETVCEVKENLSAYMIDHFSGED